MNKIRKGDNVIVITGKDKGRRGTVLAIKDAARLLSRDVPSPASLGQWRQRVPRTLHEKLKITAAHEGVSLNAFVASVLAEAVGKRVP